MEKSSLENCKKLFHYYKSLGDKTFDLLKEDHFFIQPSSHSNSIAIIVKHLTGNMLSRWTHFLTEDGEKSWRNRDDEFINTYHSKKELIHAWEKGWNCLFTTLNTINNNNKDTIIYIRNQAHTISEAVQRQLSHYSYHVGQIVFIGKLLTNKNWNSLSIPLNQSKEYNTLKFSETKKNNHFTDN